MLVENDGWKALPAFVPFLNAMTNIPDLGDNTLADRNYFVEASNCFFRHYKEMFGKHVAKNVLTNDIVIYLIGGNATLARMLLNWLVVAKESSNVNSSIFLNERLWLRKEHGSSDDPLLVIDTRKCLKYLTSTADPLEILKDQLIV